jgi:DNA polymerase III alpha subunit (gram-positive type)
MSKEEIYFSCDIESDGPIPGKFSMLSLGSAAFKADGTMLGTFSVNLQTLPEASQDLNTMLFWEDNKLAYDATRQNIIEPKLAMEQFSNWVNNFNCSPVFVGYPASFDFLFVYWYLISFIGESPFGFSALDIKTYAMSLLKTKFRKTTKKNMPARLFSKSPHTHIAVDDAIEQGELFINMLKENK